MVLAAAEKKNMVLRLTRVWYWAVLAGLPLVFYNGFFDITEVKTAWFVVCAVLYLMGRLVCAIQFGLGARRRPTPAETCALAFCFFTLIASLGSGFFTASVTGAEGRWQGMGMFWLYAALWFALRDAAVRPEDVMLPLCVGMAVSAVLSICNHMGLDLLGLEAPLGPFDQGRYISTLGNINFAGAYYSLTVPVAAWALLHAETCRDQWLRGAVYTLGLWAAMAVRSECAVLGLGTGLALLPLTLRDKNTFQRWCLLLPGTALLMQFCRLGALLFGAGFSALTRLLLHPLSAAAMALLGGLLFLLLHRTDISRFRKNYALALLVLLLTAALALLALNTILSQVPLGPLENWLRFSDEWGTDRIKVWKHCLVLRQSFGPWEKLFGGGCGILARMDALDRVFPDAVLDAAHCEYLQILLNWGVLGLVTYLGWIILSLREGLRRSGTLSPALTAGLVAYAVQAAVNIAQSPGIELFFVLLAAQRIVSDPAKP